jgi:hypothetical protein
MSSLTGKVKNDSHFIRWTEYTELYLAKLFLVWSISEVNFLIIIFSFYHKI